MIYHNIKPLSRITAEQLEQLLAEAEKASIAIAKAEK